MNVSLQRGQPVYAETKPSVADGLVASRPGDLTFPLVRQYVKDVLLVSEEEIVRAVSHLHEVEKLVIEPSGAVSVAALVRYFTGAEPRRKVVCVLTGGNVERGRLLEMLASVPPA